MRKHREIRWSEIARAAISSHAAKLDIMDKIAAKSRLTLEDIEELNEKVKEGLLNENSY